MAGAADTAKLIASLTLKDGLTPVVKTVGTSLDHLDTRVNKSASRLSKVGAGIGTALKAGAVVGIGALGGLAALSVSLAKEGQEAAAVQVRFAQAVQNSGKVSAAQVKALEAQQSALLDLSGIDDEVIKAEQTRLIQMGLTGDKVAQLTALSLDLSKATGKDLASATLAVGKAAQGSNTALQRLGIILPKNADAVAELTRRFGGTTKALSGGLDVRLDVLRERLANVREEAGIKLLPAMTKIVDVVGRKLVPAFGSFVDTILPSLIGGLDKLGGFLQAGGATDTINAFLKTAKDLAPAIQQSAEITGRVITTAVDAFKSLPPELQALAIAGLTVNKLTGGLVTNLAGGLISAILGQLKSAVVNIAAANVNVVGGGGLPTGGGGGLIATLGPAGLAAISAGILAGAVNAAGNPGVQAQLQSGGGAVGQRATQFQKGTTQAVQSGFHQLLNATDRAKAAAAANARAIAATIRAQDLTPNVIIRNTVPVTTQTIINGRLVAANFSRYTSVIGGKVVNATSGSGV